MSTPSPQESVAPSPQEPPKTSQLAIWSLTLGILSFCTSILTGLPGLILGILGLRKINAEPQTYGGKGLAIAGIIVSSVGMVTGVTSIAVLASMSMPAYMKIQEKAHETRVVADARTLVVACIHWSALNEGSFPPDLETLVAGEIIATDLLQWTHPRTKEAMPWTYHPGLSQQASADTVLFETGDLGDGSRIAAFVDGHVETLPASP